MSKYHRMRRSLLLFLCLILLIANLSAQISEGGVPYSSSVAGLKSSAAIPKVQLKVIEIDQLLADDVLKPIPYRYAVFQDTLINLKTRGKTDIIGGMGKIWRISIQSGQAKSIQIFFKKFIIPPGAKVFVYNESKSIIRGAFTEKNMQPDFSLMLADFPGAQMTVEYFEPDNPQFNGEIVIGSISQAYRDIFTELSDEDYVNINCPEGKDVQLNKHAVSKITFMSEGVSYLCSGSLINNARNDGTPYFITANHCISKSDEASSMVAYFNYEVAGCDGVASTPVTLSGANLLITTNKSDFTLLQLQNTPPNTAQPFYAGWDVNDTITNNVVGIHHPLGQTKKYCIDYDSIYANPFPINWTESNSTSPEGSHWLVGFDVGITSGGSSGSPLFNEKRQIIGQLHGGSNDIDFYGKLSYSYANPPDSVSSLQKYLDPDSTGVMVLDGYYPADNPPDAFFTLPGYKVCVDAPVKLADYSVFAPYERSWIITPSTYTYKDGTTEKSSGPVIEFSNIGLYTISLVATNAFGTDTMIIADGIQAGTTIDISVETFPSGDICLCDFKQIQLRALGANTYSWSVSPNDTNKVGLNSESGDTVDVSAHPGYNPEAGYSFEIITIGRHGVCADTLQNTYEVLKPLNDEIVNAILLSYGKSVSYDNICASVEDGEPIPPYTSCTSQLSWCDEYGTGEDIVENSVWFRFVAPTSGKVRIWSTGMDNEIALYEANSEADILNGNYKLLGANDDRTDTDYHPSIRSADVVPGNTYWVQVDGSGGGLEDSFYIHLYEMTSSGTFDLPENKLQVYPQPASEFVFIKGEELSHSSGLHLEVYNSAGTLILKENPHISQDAIMIDVSDWDPGVYIARVNAGNTLFTARIVKY